MDTTQRTYDIAAYIWPSYTGDEPRSRMFWPEGNGEWETVRKATAKFPGHPWPRRPLWGYVNEADSRVMEMQIDAAADHGVNVFIYDWYWYDGRPFLEQCLNEGYLKARNNHRVKFYLMWANHDVTHLWDRRISHIDGNIIWQASVDRAEFEVIAQRLIDRYFTHPSYYRIDGKPVFMIYDLGKLVRGLGGIAQTAEAFAWFRQQAVKAGLPGLHLQLTSLGAKHLNLSGIDAGATATLSEVVNQLGFDSQSHYQFVHFTNIDRDYADILPDMQAEWKLMDANFDVPYFPHVSLGWDNNPRHQDFRPGITRKNSPEEIAKALRLARAYADAHPHQVPLITINSWNEWTEGSYLQPDDLYGYGYLEVVKSVFTGPSS
jgi:Glycosyltransferase WbsX